MFSLRHPQTATILSLIRAALAALLVSAFLLVGMAAADPFVFLRFAGLAAVSAVLTLDRDDLALALDSVRFAAKPISIPRILTRQKLFPLLI